jgi:shikimate dehydrogenase
MPSKLYSLGLIGYPLGHSLSPQIHAAALHTLAISGEYSLYPIAPFPTGKDQLAALLDAFKDGDIQGLNVTIPHKQNVIPLLDQLTPAAETIGAVNTIFMQDGKLTGDNTDAPGFWGDLQRWARSANLGFQKPHIALVIGAGGSARAVVYALLMHGYHVAITTRRLAQAYELYDQFSGVSNQLSVIDCIHNSMRTDHFSLLVNTTPVGMHPHEDASPWPSGIPLPVNAKIYDLVYNPRETLLVKQARRAGLCAVTGLGMLVEQAALAFERWIGVEAPRDKMMQAAERLNYE